MAGSPKRDSGGKLGTSGTVFNRATSESHLSLRIISSFMSHLYAQVPASVNVAESARCIICGYVYTYMQMYNVFVK